MNCVLRQLHAIQGISCIGWHGPDRVGWINVLDSGHLAVFGKIIRNLLLHEFSNGRQLFVATGIRFGAGA